MARSKTDFVFIFFILGTFLVLKGGWGTPKVGLVQKTIGKVIGRCVGNLGNIVCTSNPNNGQGHQNAQGLAAMRILYHSDVATVSIEPTYVHTS